MDRAYLVEVCLDIHSPYSSSTVMYLAKTPQAAICYALANLAELKENDLYNITCELVESEDMDKPFVGKVFPDGSLMLGVDYPELEVEFPENVTMWNNKREGYKDV